MVADKPPKKRVVHVDPLAVTESLGFQTFRRESRKPWSKAEDDHLSALIAEMYPEGAVDPDKVKWDVVAQRMPPHGHRKAKDCRKRWSNSLDPHLRKGKWRPDEDAKLLEAHALFGASWQKVAALIPGRTDDQCAKRYIEVLDPNMKDRLKPWSRDEDLRLVRLVKAHGTKWRTISGEFSGRTSLTCRNRWRKLVTEVARGKADDIIKRAVDTVTQASAAPSVEQSNRGLLSTPMAEPAPSQTSAADGASGASAMSATTSASATTADGAPVSKPMTSTTEWKYALEPQAANAFADYPHKKLFGDAGGVIKSQELAQYLVEYAKQQGLDVTVHQHVHHHYSPVGRERSSTPAAAYGADLFGDSELTNRKLSALLEPETQLSRYQHFNYLSPLTEVPKLTSSTSPPTSNPSKAPPAPGAAPHPSKASAAPPPAPDPSKEKDDLISAFVGASSSSRLTPLTQAVEMAAAAETELPKEDDDEMDFWDSMRMSYPVPGMEPSKTKPVSQHHPLHYEDGRSAPMPPPHQPQPSTTAAATQSRKRRRQDDERSTNSAERIVAEEEDVDADMLNQYGLFYNIYTKEGQVNPEPPSEPQPKRSIYDQWGGFGIIPFNPS
ncbi:hypothetical protein DIURU_004070 [Diutina rugosa]|uniref:Uncharacterized protein n=1 Tax=Diutina rugosa TaxID=5481 RepID=A0A642UIR3_DIURU|nr:uncharacterized protein DIURU_004070 [Diutina rugosa]KAA8899813.1 hypothetical protein DIURU_004070 [Diutina rugosa]